MRRGTVQAALAMLLLAGCNAIFGIESGELAESAATTSGTGGSNTGGSGGDTPTGGGGSGTGGSAMCGDGPATAVGGLRWAHGSNGGNDPEAQATAVALGANGNVIIAGTYQGDVQIGGTMLPETPNYVGFLAAFEVIEGNNQWVLPFTGQGEHYLSDLAVGTNGDIALVGYFDGTISFDGGETELSAVGAPQGDAFVAVFDESSGARWGRQLGNASDTTGISAAFDGSGNVFITILGGAPLTFDDGTRGAAGDYGLFLAKYDANGTTLWSRFFNSSALDGAFAGVATAPDGGVVVTASTNGNVFGSTDAMHGDTAVAVAKFDSDGVPVWSRLFSGTAGSFFRHWGAAVAVDCTGDVVVTGGFEGNIVFDDAGTFQNPDSAEGPDPGDIFLAKLEGTDGKVQWAKTFHDAGYQSGGTFKRAYPGGSIGTDLGGNILLSAVVYDTYASTGLDLGGGVLPASTFEVSGGDVFWEDMLLAKFDATGGHLWSKRFKNQPNGEFIQRGEAAITPAGAIVAAGEYYFSIDLDPKPKGNLAAMHDFFLASFDP